MPRAALTLISLLSLAAACGGGDDAPASPVDRHVVRDSAGVRIVESAIDGLPELAVDGEPVLSIGALEGGPEELYRVRSIDRLSDGRWVIANAGSSEVRIFSRDGIFESAFGGEGEGPGEFQAMSWLQVFAGDSIAVWDSRARRASIFSPDGVLRRDFTTLGSGEELPSSPVARLANGRWLGSSGTRFSQSMEGERMLRPDTRRTLLGPEGDLVRELVVEPGSEQWLMVGSDFVAIRSVPFAKRAVLEASDDRIFIGRTEEPRVRVRDGEGELSEIWHVRVTPPEVTAADWDGAKRRQIGDSDDPEVLADAEDFFSKVPPPEYHPVFAEILATEEGELWVKRFSSPAGPERNDWWRFDGEGRLRDLLALPVGFAPDWVGDGMVVGTETDEFEVEYVRGYRLPTG